jgi:hypothetical protein
MHRLLQFFKKVSYFIPFTAYFLVFAAIIIPGYFWLNKISKLPDSAYAAVFSLLLTVALVFCVAILIFGFVTVFSSFIYFKLKQRKGKINLAFKTSGTTETANSKQQVNIRINPILLPLMGFLRVRIFYDKEYVSKKISLASGKNSLFGLSYEGTFNWNLPEIKEYHIEKIIFYFEDMFQFFSFAVAATTSNHFFVGPNNASLKKVNASNRKTEDTTTRIEELKKVEGELINYKNFETSDDVRRIVWKIYAKNKELVIRIPEILDPYASELYIYTSFYSQFNLKNNEVIEKAFLNYYKTVCWSVYQQLLQRGFEVKYIADQPVPPTRADNQKDAVKYAISVSSWQNDTNLTDFVKPKQASVLIISSLSDLVQVKEFAENLGSEITIVYVPLTECLEQNGITDWVKWLFVENEVSSVNKTLWNVSPLRLKVNQNENKIAEIMKNANKSVTV